MSFINNLFRKKIDLKSSNEDELQVVQNVKENKVDVNKPIEYPRLKALLGHYNQHHSDDNLNDVYEVIVMNAHFLSVITLSEEPEQNGHGTATFKKDAVMQFPMLATQDRHFFYPVFTDWVELGKWLEVKSPKTLVLSFDDYAAMVLRDEKTQGIVINPLSENMVINREMMEHLKTTKDIITKGVSEQKINKSTRVLLGEPKRYPSEMVAAISDYVKNKSTVNRVWLRLMQRDKEQSYLLVVDFHDDKRTIFNGIADAARPYLKGMYLDMVPYQEGLGKDAVENVKPFYQK